MRWDVVHRRCSELGVPDSDTHRGRLFDVNRSTVLRWRSGQTGVSLATARHVARVLGVQLDQLLVDGDGEQSNG